LLADLASVWETHGESVLSRLAVTEPGKLAQIAYGLLPRDVFISVEQRARGNLEPDEWATLQRVLDIIQANAPEGAEPSHVFETIETALRARRLQKNGQLSGLCRPDDLMQTFDHASI
jgi:hypothetical protein